MNQKDKFFYILLAIISFLAIFGALIYKFYALNWPGIIIALALTAGGLWFFKRELARENWLSEKIHFNFKENKSTLIYFFLFLISCFLLFTSQTDQAITSPWQIVNKNFFPTYIFTTLSLIWLIKKSTANSLFFISLHYFLSFSILLFVFKLGYGYDPFIHQASLELIDKQGFILPKNFFYLGYYALILIPHKLFFLPIIWLNKILVSVLAAIILPKIISNFLKKSFPNSSFIIHHSSLFLLILPFSIFTISVPQNLAYLFLIAAVFISLTEKKRLNLILTWLLCLACLAVHPLAGIPALFLGLALTAWHFLPRLKQYLVYGLTFLILIIILPLALYVSQTGGTGTEAPIVKNTTSIFWGFSRQADPILNFIHLFSYNQNYWLIILAITGIILSFVWRKKNEFLPIVSGLSISLFLAFIITQKTVNFNGLISYERGDYLQRILTSAFIFLLPAMALIFSWLINKISEKNIFIKTAWLIFGLMLISASLYCSYPRRDAYFNSRSFSVSRSDFEAVKFIEKDAADQPYIVLANQQVSVAALKTFGFNRYYDYHFSENIQAGTSKNIEKLYFYPIPTGGPLYQTYLKMVYEKADKKTAQEAANITGVKIAYFVINDYWWGFDKIIEEAKIEANSTFEINGGKAIIFKYTY